MQLHHIALTVKDLSASIKFYEEHFGLKESLRFRRDDMKATGVHIQGENIILELWGFDETTTTGTQEDLSKIGIKHIAFTHEDPISLHTLFTQKGINCGEIKIGASGGIYFFLADPDGNQIEIYKPKQ